LSSAEDHIRGGACRRGRLPRRFRSPLARTGAKILVVQPLNLDAPIAGDPVLALGRRGRGIAPNAPSSQRRLLRNDCRWPPQFAHARRDRDDARTENRAALNPAYAPHNRTR